MKTPGAVCGTVGQDGTTRDISEDGTHDMGHVKIP